MSRGSRLALNNHRSKIEQCPLAFRSCLPDAAWREWYGRDVGVTYHQSCIIVVVRWLDSVMFVAQCYEVRGVIRAPKSAWDDVVHFKNMMPPPSERLVVHDPALLILADPIPPQDVPSHQVP